MRHRGRHRVERTCVQQQSLVGRSEMISSRMTSGRSLMRSTEDSTGSSDPGGGACRFSPRYRVRDLQPASPLVGASSYWRWGQQTPFSLWASRRAHGFEQSSQRRAWWQCEWGRRRAGDFCRSGRRGAGVFCRVRKKVSGVFWTSEEDWGAGGMGWGNGSGRARCSCL